MAKQLSLGNNEVALAVMENLEDGIADVLKHHSDRRVGDGKSSTVIIKITVTPANQSRDSFKTAVVRDVNYAKRDSESWEGRLFVKFDDAGEVNEVSDINPRQMRMDLSER